MAGALYTSIVWMSDKNLATVSTEVHYKYDYRNFFRAPNVVSKGQVWVFCDLDTVIV